MTDLTICGCFYFFVTTASSEGKELKKIWHEQISLAAELPEDLVDDVDSALAGVGEESLFLREVVTDYSMGTADPD